MIFNFNSMFLKKILFVLLLMSCVSCNGFGTVVTDLVSGEKGQTAREIESRNLDTTNNEDEQEDIRFLVKITRVVDGDTVEMLYHELTLTMRLAHIDAPESWGNQAYGEAAKALLKKMCEGKTVFVRTTGEFDRYGRLIGEIITREGVNLNKAMVRLGYAWHYKKYSENKAYQRLQKQAENENNGLWAAEHPVAPWEFRRR